MPVSLQDGVQALAMADAAQRSFDSRPVRLADVKSLDLITIGRSSVDLYGAQIGGRLEDMRSFDKYIGGSPTNIAWGQRLSG